MRNAIHIKIKINTNLRFTDVSSIDGSGCKERSAQISARICSVCATERCHVVQCRGTASFLDKSDITDLVINVVKNFQEVDPSKIMPEAHFQNDLGLDSLDAIEVVMALEEEFRFEIPDNEADIC